MRNQYEELLTAVTGISHALKRAKSADMKKAGLQGTDAVLLVEMDVHPEGLTNAQLSRLCDMDKAAISRQVSTLAKKGLIKINKPKGRRYGATHTLTARGQKLADKLQKAGSDLLNKENIGLSKKELDALNKSLKQLAEALKEAGA